ncbi:MAG: dihydrofolate reductase [Oryzihumus sp.]
MSVTLLAAVGANRVIGRDNDLPWRLPEDLAHFKTVTMGHTLVMGRRTFDSIGRPLPGRRIVVVTRQPDWSREGVAVAHSLPEALRIAVADGDTEVFVVGGGQIYAEALPVATRLLLTEVEQSPEGDTLFPEVDGADWSETARDQREGFAFVTYQRTWRD